MIQSIKSESKSMKIKNFVNKTVDFFIKRFIELIGLILVTISILFFISLASYSPEDANFIISDSDISKNLLGFEGSFTSDIFLQSFGVISFLIPLTLFFTAIDIILKKKMIFVIENTFFMILYLITGSIFFKIFYNESFSLTINGNAGFVGNYISGINSFWC